MQLSAICRIVASAAQGVSQKGYTHMTTHNEKRHQQRVTHSISDVSDTETQIDMREVADQYRRIRQALIIALSEMQKLDDEYGHEHDQIGELRQMLITLRLEELGMHDVISSLFDDDAQVGA